ncbi:MAG: hypothetical protein RLZZ28_2494 [Bacteroidota bacterium]|jgi:hypothetical protein
MSPVQKMPGFSFTNNERAGYPLFCNFAPERNIMSELFVNKVAESGIISFDLEAYYPKEAIKTFDLKAYLFMGLILKEKDFRASLQTTDWSQYQDCHVAITCTADAIIPMWAYMLVASQLQPVALSVVFGDEKKLISTILLKNLESVKGETFTDQRVVIKGCGDVEIPETAYVEITNKLRPYVKSIMYGEPCSTVPIYKKKQA